MLKPLNQDVLQNIIETMGHRERLVFKSCIEFKDYDIDSNIEVYRVNDDHGAVIKVSIVDHDGKVIKYNGKNQMQNKRLKRWKSANYTKLLSMIADPDVSIPYCII